MTKPDYMSLQPVIILGMHRSGTSCLAGSLEQAGLSLGDVNRKAPHNAKGNRENFDIMALHDALLAANGGSWDDPPWSVKWSPEQKLQRDHLNDTYPAYSDWGFKDPRTLLTLSGWLDALPNARLVGTFRHPLAVARSLQARNQFPLEAGLDLWMSNNRMLLQYHLDRGVDLICFDWPPERYTRGLKAIAAKLGLTVPRDGFSFYEPGLRKNDVTGEADLPVPVAEVYHSLLECVS
mgnify:CR=1 FL=1